MRVRLYNPTNRNTQAHVVEVGDDTYYFSYETCIAFRGIRGGKSLVIRRPNDWGPTTGRHFKEMGCFEWETVDADLFERIVADELSEEEFLCPTCLPSEPCIHSAINSARHWHKKSA